MPDFHLDRIVSLRKAQRPGRRPVVSTSFPPFEPVGHSPASAGSLPAATRAPSRHEDFDNILGDANLRAFWRSYIRLGFVVLGTESLAVAAYGVTDHVEPHRTLLVLTGGVFALLSIAGFARAHRLASTPWRARYSLGLSLASGLAISVLAALNGGMDSPLVLLAVLPVVYAAVGLDQVGVMVCSAVAVAELSVVWVLDSDLRQSRPDMFVTAALVVGVAVLAIASAAQRSRLQADELVLIEELRRLAEVDGLTNCWNHRVFHERLDLEIQRAVSRRLPLSVLVCDLDHLAAYNAAHGSEAGDHALAAVGSVFRSAVRVGDLAARTGGDEFAVLMPATDAAGARALAHRIRQALEDDESVPVTVGMGVAELDPERPTSRRLMRDAESSLLEAKLSRRAADMGTSPAVLRHPTARTARPGTTGEDDERRRIVAEVRHAKRESDEVREVLQTLVQDAPAGFALIDPSMRVVMANRSMYQAVHVDPTVPLGRPMSDVIPGLAARIEPLCRLVLETRRPLFDVELADADLTRADRRAWLSNFYPVEVDRDVIGVGVVAVDITDRRKLEEAGRELTDAVVSALAATAEARDPYTAGHQRRVSELAAAIATALGHDEDSMRGIRMAGAIHDIGKVAVPAELLSRPGRLLPAEMELIKCHSAAGFEILSGIDFPWPVARMVRQHHERLDGSGYPDGLRGDQILVGARIIAVADVVEAMAAHRPYRPSLGLDAALTSIEAARGRLYDPDVVDACLMLFHTGQLDPDLMQALHAHELYGPATLL